MQRITTLPQSRKDVLRAIITAEDGSIVWDGIARDVKDAIQRSGFTRYPYRWLGTLDDALFRAIDLGVECRIAQVELVTADGSTHDCVCVTSTDLDPMPWDWAKVVNLGPV